MRILILDDQPGLAEILAAGLRFHGHSVKAFTSAIETLKAVRESDVLISDYHMPEMTGLEVVRRAYDQGWRGSFLLMSGNATQIEEILEHPLLRSVLNKPFSVQTLINVLST